MKFVRPPEWDSAFDASLAWHWHANVSLVSGFQSRGSWIDRFRTLKNFVKVRFYGQRHDALYTMRRGASRWVLVEFFVSAPTDRLSGRRCWCCAGASGSGYGDRFDFSRFTAACFCLHCLGSRFYSRSLAPCDRPVYSCGPRALLLGCARVLWYRVRSPSDWSLLALCSGVHADCLAECVEHLANWWAWSSSADRWTNRCPSRC